MPTTEGVIAALREEALRGKNVGITLYGEPNQALEDFLRQQGAVVHTVLPYVYAPGADAERVAALVEEMAAGRVDAILFTSSPQVDRLYEVATKRDQVELLEKGLARTSVAAVGPVVAQNLRERRARVDICPDQGFVMKNLVQQIKRAFAAPDS
jgi:uroporphyrinogen-III synthase